MLAEMRPTRVVAIPRLKALTTVSLAAIEGQRAAMRMRSASRFFLPVVVSLIIRGPWGVWTCKRVNV